jgi:fibronectin-binding autotransporter adhesin
MAGASRRTGRPRALRRIGLLSAAWLVLPAVALRAAPREFDTPAPQEVRTGGKALDVVQKGAGGLTIFGDLATDLVGRGSVAIFARLGNPKPAELTIRLERGVSAGRGVSAFVGGAGSLTITTTETAPVTAGATRAIDTMSGNGATTLTFGAPVKGATIGVRHALAGSGGLSVTADADVTGMTLRGIDVLELPRFKDKAIGQVRISGAGDVAGKERGISLVSSGVVEVSGTGRTTAATGSALHLRGADIRVTRSGDIASGSGSGIDASTRSSSGGPVRGDVTVTGTGSIKAGATATGILAEGHDVRIGVLGDGTRSALAHRVSGGTGIDAASAGDGSVMIVSAAGGTVEALTNGIVARNDGSGRIMLDLADRVTGRDGVGIMTSSRDGDTRISFSGAVSGAKGVVAEATGGGNLVISGTGSVSATEGSGIAAKAAGGDVFVEVLGTGPEAIVAGLRRGIEARTSGNGRITILSAPAVRGVTGAGIRTSASAGETEIGSFGDVQGLIGINAKSLSGAIAIVSQGSVQGIDGAGIRASTEGGSISIGAGRGSSVGIVSGRTIGIDAATIGTGRITVATDRDLEVSGERIGISTKAVDAATSISVGGVVSGRTGIAATAAGSGSISIDVSENATIRGTQAAIRAAVGTGSAGITIERRASLVGNALLDLETQGGAISVRNAAHLAGNIRGTASGFGTIDLLNAGTIALRSSQEVSAVRVTNEAGGILAGTGRFDAVTARSGSMILPGSGAGPTTGTLRFARLSLEPGAIVSVRAAASGASDSITVDGPAELGGATLYVQARPAAVEAWESGKSYRVLTASSVGGTFEAETDLAFLMPVLTYGPGHVDVTLARNSLPYDAVAVSPTQNAVARILQAAERDRRPVVRTLLSKITMLRNADVPDALDAISGATAMALRPVDLARSAAFGGIAAEQARLFVRNGFSSGTGGFSGSDMALYYRPTTSIGAGDPFEGLRPSGTALRPADTWRLWASMQGGSRVTEARARDGAAASRGSEFGGASGIDFLLDPDLIAGVSIGSSFGSVRSSSAAASSDSKGLSIGMHATARRDAAYVTSSLAYGRTWTRSKRIVSLPTTEPDELVADIESGSWSSWIETGYRFPVSPTAFVTPFVGFRPAILKAGASTERSDTDGLFALRYHGRDIVSLPGFAGLQFDTRFELGGGWALDAELRGAWSREFRDDRLWRASFAALPGSDFVAASPRSERDRGVVTVGAALRHEEGASLFVSVASDFSASDHSLSARFGAELRW